MATGGEHQSSKRHKTEAPAVLKNDAPELPPIPVLKTGEIALIEDVMTKIFVEMLDPASYCTATELSKAHKAALIPRQKKVWFEGFRSLESFLSMGFVGMEFISFRNCCSKVTGFDLQAIADQNRFPLVTGVDFTRAPCHYTQMASFIDSLGPRLKIFIHLALARFDSMEQPSVLAALVRSSSRLSSLHIRVVNPEVDFSGLTSLENLSLTIARRSTIDVQLPLQLRNFHIKKPARIYHRKGGGLATITDSRLPSLERLEITDPVVVLPPCSSLSAEYLIAAMDKCPKLRVLALNEVSLVSPLHRGRASEQEERLFAYLQERGIEYVGPEHVTVSSGATRAMLEQWRDRRK